jgi:hypothetical protein
MLRCPTVLVIFSEPVPDQPGSLSGLGDRSEHGGRARTDFHDFEAHSHATQREIGEIGAALTPAQQINPKSDRLLGAGFAGKACNIPNWSWKRDRRGARAPQSGFFMRLIGTGGGCRADREEVRHRLVTVCSNTQQQAGLVTWASWTRPVRRRPAGSALTAAPRSRRQVSAGRRR